MVVGEFGGSIVGVNGTTQQKLAIWLRDNCMADAFWWCLNSATDYKGGLMGRDYRTADRNVLLLMDLVQPHPTRLVPTHKGGGQICVIEGRSGNPACDGINNYKGVPPGEGMAPANKEGEAAVPAATRRSRSLRHHTKEFNHPVV